MTVASQSPTGVADEAQAQARSRAQAERGARACCEAKSARGVDRAADPLLIGLFVLCMAFSEGTGNDWLSLSVIDGYHIAAFLGDLVFAVFLTAMTAGRWFGPRLIDRYG